MKREIAHRPLEPKGSCSMEVCEHASATSCIAQDTQHISICIAEAALPSKLRRDCQHGDHGAEESRVGFMFKVIDSSPMARGSTHVTMHMHTPVHVGCGWLVD